MALTIDEFFDAAKLIRKYGLDQQLSGDDTTLQLGSRGNLLAHKWKMYTTRGKAYNDVNRQLRQDLYDGLTKRLGKLENLPEEIRDQLKLGDFIVKDGKVTSDRPLTLRRLEAIRAVVDAADHKVRPEDYGESTYKGVADDAFGRLDGTEVEAVRPVIQTKGVLARCRELCPGKVLGPEVPLSEEDVKAYATILANAPELKEDLEATLFNQTRSILIEKAEAEITSALLKQVKDVPGLDEAEVDTDSFHEACMDLELTENDTATMAQAKIDALKTAEITKRRATLVKLRDAKTLKKNPPLRTALILEDLKNPGLTPDDLQDALTLVNSFKLKPANKSEDAAMKVCVDIAKAVLAKKDKGKAYLKVIALSLAHTEAFTALIDQLPREDRVAFAYQNLSKTFFEDYLEDEEEMSDARNFFVLIANNMTYKYE